MALYAWQKTSAFISLYMKKIRLFDLFDKRLCDLEITFELNDQTVAKQLCKTILKYKRHS